MTAGCPSGPVGGSGSRATRAHSPPQRTLQTSGAGISCCLPRRQGPAAASSPQTDSHLLLDVPHLRPLSRVLSSPPPGLRIPGPSLGGDRPSPGHSPLWSSDAGGSKIKAGAPPREQGPLLPHVTGGHNVPVPAGPLLIGSFPGGPHTLDGRSGPPEPTGAQGSSFRPQSPPLRQGPQPQGRRDQPAEQGTRVMRLSRLLQCGPGARSRASPNSRPVLRLARRASPFSRPPGAAPRQSWRARSSPGPPCVPTRFRQLVCASPCPPAHRISRFQVERDGALGECVRHVGSLATPPSR